MKNSGKNSGPEPVPQPHGGSLWSGGVPGNAGGGRPKSAVRAAALAAFDERVGLMEAIADSTDERSSDRLRAVDLLGRYGAVLVDADFPDELLRALASDVHAEVEDRDTIRRIYDRWMMTMGEWYSRRA